MINQSEVSFRGRITGDPELKPYESDGERREFYRGRLMVYGMGEKGAPGFIDIAVFDNARETFESAPKDADVEFVGKLRYREWTAESGAKRSALSARGTIRLPGADEEDEGVDDAAA